MRIQAVQLRKKDDLLKLFKKLGFDSASFYVNQVKNKYKDTIDKTELDNLGDDESVIAVCFEDGSPGFAAYSDYIMVHTYSFFGLHMSHGIDVYSSLDDEWTKCDKFMSHKDSLKSVKMGFSKMVALMRKAKNEEEFLKSIKDFKLRYEYGLR